MRLMGHRALGGTPDTLEVLTTVEAIANSLTQDPGMPIRTDGRVVVEVPGQADMALQQYIIGNSLAGAGYIPGVSPYVVSNPALNAPVTSNTPGNATATAACANGDLACRSGVGAQQSSLPQMTQQGREAIAQGAADLSRQAGVIGAAATAATAVGSPQLRPITGAVAVGATAIGVTADMVEQVMRPNTGKVVTNSGSLILQTATEQIPGGRILTPITNELLEVWKSSGSSMKFQDWINSKFEGDKP